MMALAPATVHPTPARLSLAPICLHPASTTPEETDYTREAGVWDLAGALGALCAKVVRRRAEGHGSDEHGNEENEGKDEHEKNEEEHGEHDEQEGKRSAGRGHAGDRRGYARRAGASRWGGYPSRRAAGRRRWAVPHGSGRLRRGLRRSDPDARLQGADPDRAPGEAMQESVRIALSWPRPNAGR